jgi:hypothetical protein
VKEDLHLSVPGIFMIALHDALLEESKKPEDMAIQVDPIGLVEFRCISVDVFGIEVIVRGGKEGGIVDHGFFIGWLARQGVLGWLDFINISILFLLLGAHLLVVLLEILGGGEPRQKWEIRRHCFFITYVNIIFQIIYQPLNQTSILIAHPSSS